MFYVMDFQHVGAFKLNIVTVIFKHQTETRRYKNCFLFVPHATKKCHFEKNFFFSLRQIFFSLNVWIQVKHFISKGENLLFLGFRKWIIGRLGASVLFNFLKKTFLCFWVWQHLSSVLHTLHIQTWEKLKRYAGELFLQQVSGFFLVCFDVWND